MLRFSYALFDGEQLDADSLRVEEFDGFEATSDVDHGVEVAGRRCKDLDGALAALAVAAQWAVFKPVGDWKEIARRVNRSEIAGTLLVEPWMDCSSVRELWQLSEAITLPNVKIAWSSNWGERTAQPPAAVVPVLNLRLGLVRVVDAGAATIDFARRLAGIGYDGAFVVDPPQGEDRLGEARKIVEIVRDITQPRKPVKAVAARK